VGSTNSGCSKTGMARGKGERVRIASRQRGHEVGQGAKQGTPNSLPNVWQRSGSHTGVDTAEKVNTRTTEGTKYTQTTDGAVLPGGRPRYHSNVLMSSVVPSKSECLSDLRLFTLVRDGTYDEVLKELEAAAPDDAEAAWNKTKLLRLVQRHHQRTYGSIRNPVTSKRKDLTPDVTASLSQNCDKQLPTLDRPSSDMVAMRMMHDFAVLHNLHPRPLAEGELDATHQQLFVDEQVYIEKQRSQSRASSSQGLSSCASPIGKELSSVSKMSLSEGSANSLESHVRSTNSLVEISRRSTTDSRGSEKSGKSGKSGGGRQSAPPFVNRADWIFQPGLPANDCSRRDRRMNSPTGDATGDWSRISYSVFPAPETHGYWGSAWKHPQDIFKNKAGIDTQGIKTINSKEYGNVSTLMETLNRQISQSPYGVSPSKLAQCTMLLEESPKMGSVRLARESAQKEAEAFVRHMRTMRQHAQTEGQTAVLCSVASHDQEYSMVWESIREAQELWGACVDAMPAVDDVRKERLDEAMQLVLTIEKHEKKKRDSFKSLIQDIWKSDCIGEALEREEVATNSIYTTMYSIQEHASTLAETRHEKATKKVAAANLIVERTAFEMCANNEQLGQEKVSSNASATNLARVVGTRDALALEVSACEDEVEQQIKQLAVYKTKITNHESQAFEANQQGKADIVKEYKTKMEDIKLRISALRTSANKSQEKLNIFKGKLSTLEEDVFFWENTAHTDSIRLEEIQKVCSRDQEHMQELQDKLKEEQTEEEQLHQCAEQRSHSAQKARERAEQVHEQDISGVGVIDRLRASSLALVARLILSSEDPNMSTDEQEPVYLGEKLDGKREGLGILQYAAGAEYLGQFEADLPSGIGMERYADGSSFQGCFRAGQRHGMGVYVLPSQIAYLGFFQGGKRAGVGVICIGGGAASLPFWPTVVCVCRADCFEAISAVKFRTDCVQHALLISDVLVAQRASLDTAKRARQISLANFFVKQEDSQISRIEEMGLAVLSQNPSVKAFGQRDSVSETKAVVSLKMQDIERVMRLAATPVGRKVAKNFRDRSVLPFQKGQGRRHATAIYGASPSSSAHYKT